MAFGVCIISFYFIKTNHYHLYKKIAYYNYVKNHQNYDLLEEESEKPSKISRCVKITAILFPLFQFIAYTAVISYYLCISLGCTFNVTKSLDLEYNMQLHPELIAIVGSIVAVGSIAFISSLFFLFPLHIALRFVYIVN